MCWFLMSRDVKIGQLNFDLWHSYFRAKNMTERSVKFSGTCLAPMPNKETLREITVDVDNVIVSGT